MADAKPPILVPLPETKPYWAAARRHELSLPWCRSCGAFHFYPRASCPHCLSGDLEWRRVSGRGRLETFTIVHRGPKNFPLGTPYVLAVVALDEGPRLMTNLVGIAPDPAQVKIGMAVEVVFADAGDGVALPHFRPAGAAR
jgi:uncharacterized OB-fold protein